MLRYFAPLLLAALAVAVPSPAIAQPSDLLLPARAGAVASPRAVPARRVRKARVHLPALQSSSLRLELFEDVQPTLTRRTLERPSADALVWVGDDEQGSQAVLTVANGVLTGTVFADHRTFEITIDADGEYSVLELDTGAFPTDDPDAEDLVPPAAAADNAIGDATGLVATSSTSTTTTSTTAVEITVMIVWTPKAETAAGGRSAMDSLALNAVAIANLVYANSGVNARLTLVYKAPVTYTESPSSISTDLGNLRGTSDGKIDQVHTVRNQYAADVVSLIGEGYMANGACGVGGLMTSLSTSFAPYAFNVVDRKCAIGNLSYAHEVGHNEGLQHNPSNASTTPSQPYAYGYQDPSGYFRTVLSYGSSTRIPYLSNPAVTYNTRVTGTSSQNNARALNTNAATIAAFRGTSSGATTPSCTYSVSTTSLTFAASGGSKPVSVTASSGCGWTASESSNWVSLSNTGGSGSGSVTVVVPSHSGRTRSTTITVAGKSVTVKQTRK